MPKTFFCHILPSLMCSVGGLRSCVCDSGTAVRLYLYPTSSFLLSGQFCFFHILQPSAFPDVLPLFSPSPETLTRLLSSPPTPQFLFSSAYTLLFLSKVPFALIPSTSLRPESSLSVVVPRFDICVYLATASTAGNQTDRAGLNKERKLGKGNTHALRHIHKSWNACWSGPTITALCFTYRTSYVPELGLGTKLPSGSFFSADLISYCNPTHRFTQN